MPLWTSDVPQRGSLLIQIHVHCNIEQGHTDVACVCSNVSAGRDVAACTLICTFTLWIGLLNLEIAQQMLGTCGHRIERCSPTGCAHLLCTAWKWAKIPTWLCVSQACPDTSSLVAMLLLLVRVIFNTTGQLTSRYYIVPKRPLVFNVSCIYCRTHSNNDYRRDICFCVAWLNLQTLERLCFGANFLCHFERFSSLNLDIVDFTGKFHARANMILTTVPTRSFEAIK